MERRTKLDQAAFVMVFAIITISTLLYGAVHQGVLALVYFLISLAVLFWAVSMIREGTVRVSSEPIQVLIYAVAVYGLIQVVPFGTIESPVANVPRTISLDPFATQISALHFLGLGFFFSLVLASLDSASRLRKFAAFITIFGAVFAFFAIIQSLLSPTSIYGLLERPIPFGSFVSRNNFAGWMEMAISMPLGMLLTGSVSKDKRLIYLTATILMGVSIVLSGSRGGLIALVLIVAFLVFISYLQRDRGSPILKTVFGLAILASIIAGTAFVGGENTLTRISEGETVAEGMVARPQIWKTTVRMIEGNMPFGVGLGAFGVAYTRYDQASGFERVEQAHNDYLQVVSDAGVVGSILGLAFIFLIFRKGMAAVRIRNIERRGYAIGALGGIFGVLIHSLFDFNLHTMAVALLFLVFVAILTASNSKFEDDGDDPHRRHQRTHAV